jgi:hypothetical protein
MMETMALLDHEVFVMTDNIAFEGAYYKGHSPSEKLNDIVFRLHKAERDGGFILHVIHISGKQMKATGMEASQGGTFPRASLRELTPSPTSPSTEVRRKDPREQWAHGFAVGGRPRRGKIGEASPWWKCRGRRCLSSRTWRRQGYGSFPRPSWR